MFIILFLNYLTEILTQFQLPRKAGVFLLLGLYGLPKRNGKLKDISHFDASFFGVHPKQANTMDPQLRLMLEVAYEAIVDGGNNKTKQKNNRSIALLGSSVMARVNVCKKSKTQSSYFSLSSRSESQ